MAAIVPWQARPRVRRRSRPDQVTVPCVDRTLSAEEADAVLGLVVEIGLYSLIRRIGGLLLPSAVVAIGPRCRYAEAR